MATSTPAARTDGQPPPPPHGSAGKSGPRRDGSAGQSRRNLLHRLDVRGVPYAFIAPFFLIFGAFGLYPLLYTFWISLHRVELSSLDRMEWRGLANFTELIDDDRFWNALTNTFTIGVISTVPQLLMALGLAHLLNYRLRGSTFFRVAVLTPYATSIAAAALVFTMLFERDYGMINWGLGFLGVENIDFENQKWPAQFAISAIVIWRWTGYNALLYLAAMQAIPRDLYEAAAIDGASRWQQFRQVTVPGISATIVFTIVLSTIGATQLFGEPLIFGQGPNGISGGADNQYQTLGLLLYEEGWRNYQMGRAATIAWAMFLILILVFVLQRVVTGVRARRSARPASATRKTPATPKAPSTPSVPS
ncbi:sugar ABC transporter permease [Streptomyces sp. NBC_01498]|uniref:carbohydrate ABC transporter permease n=1 Tax=Streptomyces sp. NBC_01498 TaxID=2975870 RepID=UPI002E7BE91E|nr:sugar ABC transporter permease [Streptomyces sp. NBC_01498]WTL28474.1 sugar ABC transporter permease [Streptomyces sp. NBC_01498]